MAGPADTSRGVSYDPLPLTGEDHGDGLYNDPSRSLTGTPQPGGLHQMQSTDDFGIPSGAAQPRFLGAALYNDGTGITRDSYASSHNTSPAGRDSEYSSSVYGLTEGQRDSPGQLYAGGYRDDPRDAEYYGGEPGVPMAAVGSRGSRYMEEKRAVYAAPRSKRKIIIACGILAGILIILAVVIPVYFAVVKPGSDSSDSNGGTNSDGSPASPTSTGTNNVLITGGSGSKVTTDEGEEFTYENDFGGYWYYNPEDPWHNGAKAQAWTPALNETFHYGQDRIRGVNVGGWLTMEPFISPAVFEPYADRDDPAVDEYTLHSLVFAEDGNFDKIEEHYKTFITEKDFADIAAAGLNFIRLPIPFWAVDTLPDEPFYPKAAWGYFLKAIEWARKYGLRINLDLHALPGSQNGWNHSGRLGTVNFMNGPMGYANAQRALDIIRVIAEFISQPQYRDVVPIFGIANEIQGPVIGQDQVQAFYRQAYEIVRNAGGGTGEDKGVWISLHDAFFGRDDWAGFLAGGDRMSLDSHPYIAFGGQSGAAMSTFANTPCQNWGAGVNGTMASFGLANAGEWSNAISDCGLYLNGVGLGTRYEGNYTEPTERIGSCEPLLDYKSWDDGMKADVKQFAMASMDALQNSFFWTWKIGESSVYRSVRTPAWSYSLGLSEGWMPTDPREADGVCGNTDPFEGGLQPWQTGGDGAGTITVPTGSLVWPPATFSHAGAVTDLPSYTPTGSVPTLPALTAISASATATKVDLGNGWNNDDDREGFMVPIGSCSYLDPYPGPTAAPPSPLCS